MSPLAQRQAAHVPNAIIYSVAMIERAKAHYAAGWKVTQIPGLLDGEFGVCPASTTVRRWVDPAYAEKQAAWNRAKAASQSRAYRLRVMRELRARGLSLQGVGQVSAVLWGEELSGGQVKTRLAGRKGYAKPGLIVEGLKA